MKQLFFFITGLFSAISVFSQASWSLTGNAGTNNSTNFVGTTDNTPLILKVNNQWAGFTGYPNKNNVSFGYLSLTNALVNGTANAAFGAQALQWNKNSSGNVAIGTWALEWCTSGDNNVAVGTSAMGNSMNVSSHNVAIGEKALFNNTQSSISSNPSGNTAVGSNAAFSNTEGLALTAIGYKSLCNNTTGEFNTALGYQALLLNTTGYWNVALGSGSLQWNLTGRFNTAGGNSSMHFNRTGVENTAFGEQALSGGIDGSYNTAVGCRSLWSVNYTPETGDVGYGHGECNTAVGYESLRMITTGNWNVGMGVRALQMNSTGSDNIAMGCYSLSNNTTGSYNISIGNQALNSITTGRENIAIGYGANVSAGYLNNVIIIGNGAKATSSNQIVIGNSKVNSIRAYVPWTTISDERIKSNVQKNVPGLNFIKLLEPVTYNMDLDAVDKILKTGKIQENTNDSLQSFIPSIDTQEKASYEKRLWTGLIAQQVEQAAKSIGYDFSGVDVDENGLYGLRYSKFIVPLVKSVQELSVYNDSMEAIINSLQDQVDELVKMVRDILDRNITQTGMTNSISVQGAFLEQNYPNPFNQSTIIKYNLPQIFHSARIVIADFSGRLSKEIPIFGTGSGNITLDAGSLSTGIHFYSLFVDNALIDTKKMIITR